MWLTGCYEKEKDKSKFFNDFFDKLAGTDTLRKQIIAGTPEKDIRKSWEPALSNFRKTREKYLLYPDYVN